MKRCRSQKKTLSPTLNLKSMIQLLACSSAYSCCSKLILNYLNMYMHLFKFWHQVPLFPMRSNFNLIPDTMVFYTPYHTMPQMVPSLWRRDRCYCKQTQHRQDCQTTCSQNISHKLTAHPLGYGSFAQSAHQSGVVL